MTLRIREFADNLKSQHYMALYGELAVEETVGL
jgi:hypothetical protein